MPDGFRPELAATGAMTVLTGPAPVPTLKGLTGEEKRLMRFIFIVSLLLMLAACGGSGGGQPTSTSPPGQPPREPDQPRNSETHRGASLAYRNFDLSSGRYWYANPRIDLPRHGRDGIHVDMPLQGGGAVARVKMGPSLADRLEPGWRYDSEASDRLELAAGVLWILANRAYLQWTRHLDYDPGPMALQLGEDGDLNCGHGSTILACYSPSHNAVVLRDRWLAQIYENLVSYRQDRSSAAIMELFWVLTHEAGHQFGYMNPDGTADGCGETRCHAPYGSGSVISYDQLVRFDVTEEDIRHIPNATWNSDDSDRYTVWKSGEPSSIDNWGVWIEHFFEVDGRADTRDFRKGSLSFVDEIAGAGWVHGKPSENVSLATTATWSGEDNFLGVDHSPGYLGALLRADANLRYTFGARPNLNLRVNSFEAHYSEGDGGAKWHDHSFSNWGDFSYNMDCTSGGCSGESAEAKWYPSDAGDPSGWVAGVVSDLDNAYVGSFVAEKD